jgi:hypothetical protein
MINILGKKIKIFLVDPEEGFEMRRYGQADTIAGNIKLNKNSPKEIQFQTLLHEIIHFWDEDIGLGYPNDAEDDEARDKINRLATCIYLLFVENNIDFDCLLKYDNPKDKTRSKYGKRGEDAD